MRSDLLTAVMGNRSRDWHVVILPFTLAHSAILIILGFGGAGLEDSGVQLALAAMSVLGSLWIVIAFDGAIADLAAGMKDMDEEMASSHIGGNFAKAPFAAFRILNVAIVALIVIAELMAIY